MGDRGAVMLLGLHGVEGGLQVGADRGCGLLAGET